jgi:hypothetical protein
MNNGSVRGFERRRYDIHPGNSLGALPRLRTGINKPSLLTELNKRAKKAAREAYTFVTKLLDRAGVTPGVIPSDGAGLLALTTAAGIAKKHGFTLWGEPTYRQLHPTKGYRKVPA